MKKPQLSSTASTILLLILGFIAYFWPLLFGLPALASLPKANLPTTWKATGATSLIIFNIWWFYMLCKAVKVNLARREAENNQAMGKTTK